MKEVQFGNLTLKLRLSLDEIEAIEARLGNKALMSLFLDRDGSKMPSIKDCLIFLQGANQVHGVTDEKIKDACRKFLQDGHTTMDLLQLVTETMQDGGFFGKKGTQSKTNSVSQLKTSVKNQK